MKSIDEHMELVGRYLGGQATADEVAQLEALMRDDPQLRADFLAYARIDAALPAAIGEKPTLVELEPSSAAKSRRLPWARLAAAAVILLIIAGSQFWPGRDDPEASQGIAQIVELRDTEWRNAATQIDTGDLITSGQQIDLLSGSAEMEFDSGARMTIVGPAIVEPLSGNSALLILGEVRVVAETPESKGFTLTTPTSKFVDIGTAFTATVAPDGLSRLEVSEGEVDVVMDSTGPSQHLKAGETLFVEPGRRKIVTRMEPGDGTAAFRFPTIDPPSHEDYADRSRGHATIRVAQGKLKRKPGNSGPPEALLDGKGQSRQDAPDQSAFFQNDVTGSFLVDLGRTISITKVNSYSWHQHNRVDEHRERAQQRFMLYGFAGEEPPDLSLPPEEAGWTRLARVNSDQFFRVNERLDRPAQQACSITSATGEVGRYRYLLWVTKGYTFFGEFDVFGTP